MAGCVSGSSSSSASSPAWLRPPPTTTSGSAREVRVRSYLLHNLKVFTTRGFPTLFLIEMRHLNINLSLLAVFESEGLGSDPWSWTFWGTETGHSLRRQVETEASTQVGYRGSVLGLNLNLSLLQTIGAETDFTDDRLGESDRGVSLLSIKLAKLVPRSLKPICNYLTAVFISIINTIQCTGA